MVAALMATVTSIERAKSRGKASELVALQAIAAHGNVQPSTLSVELRLHQSSVTRQIQAFERAGFVKVAANPADGRSCHVSLTAAGRAELRRLTQFGLKRFALFVEEWDAKDVRTLARLLERFEKSKAEVARREARSAGRAWQQKTG
jgi:MarR family transcriptional regulator, temperature-dependent positive regulator of motility